MYQVVASSKLRRDKKIAATGTEVKTRYKKIHASIERFFSIFLFPFTDLLIINAGSETSNKS